MVRYTKQVFAISDKMEYNSSIKRVGITKYMAAEWERIMGDGKKNERDSSGVSDRRACAVSGKNLKIYDTIFDDGESPLKEDRNIELYGSMFKWKYPAVVCDIKWQELYLV